MKALKRIAKQRERRTYRIRNQIRRSANGRPRLTIFRSNRHMYAQIIDDAQSSTLVSASTLEASLGGAGKAQGNVDSAAKIGQVIAERAKEKGISQVVFDRGPYGYHGRVEAVAKAAREAGLEF